MKITLEAEPEEIAALLGLTRQRQQLALPVHSQREVSHREIRAWARSSGMAVATTGALPRDVIESYYSERL